MKDTNNWTFMLALRDKFLPRFLANKLFHPRRGNKRNG